MANQAIGFLETRGVVGLIAATDTMAKAAKVELVRRLEIGGGYVTTVLQGDVGSVRAAIDAGAASVKAADGELVAAHMIPHPVDGLLDPYLG